MTPDERALLADIHRALKGDPFSEEKGMMGQMLDFDLRLSAMEKKQQKLLILARGIAIGFLACALVFGFVSKEAFISWLKHIL